jgi:hypothetical protein
MLSNFVYLPLGSYNPSVPKLNITFQELSGAFACDLFSDISYEIILDKRRDRFHVSSEDGTLAACDLLTVADRSYFRVRCNISHLLPVDTDSRTDQSEAISVMNVITNSIEIRNAHQVMTTPSSLRNQT